MDLPKIATDETLRETVRHGDGSYPFAYYLEDVWQFDFHRIDWHWHHELEFVAVTEGTVLCLVGQDQIQLSKGCGLFVNSGILHRFESRASALIPNIVFSPSLLAPEKSLIYQNYVLPVLRSSAGYQVFDPGTDWQNQALQLLAEIFALQELGENQELQTVQLLLRLWELLFRNLDLTPIPPELRHLNHQQAKLQTMMQYVHDHYAQELTLEEIAASASISKSSALHIFQSCIHTSPVAYLIQYRLKQAASQLCTTEKSISSIAEETGFASPGYFCRRFRQAYGITPNRYRRKQA